MSNPMDDQLFNVLILCTGNSARSIIAEALINKYGLADNGRRRFRGYSAGSKPTGKVNPHALKLLQKRNHDTAFARSKNWDEFTRPDAPALDFIFTVCDNAAAETCPIWPGKPVSAHWGIPDPARATGTEAEIERAFAEAYQSLEQRISRFASLPFDRLDQQGLQAELNNIGIQFSSDSNK